MIEIKLSDIPEFKKQLKITITLEKDGEGIRESVITTPDPSPSLGSPVVDAPVVPTNVTQRKRTTKKSTTGEVENNDTGDGSTLSTTKETPKSPKKYSGNMMNLDF